MACSTTLAGIAKDCEVNAGGVLNVYIASHADVTGVTVADGMITAVTMEAGTKFHQFYVRKGVANYTGAPSYNEDGDYVGEDGTLSLVFSRMDTSKRIQVEALSSQDLAVIFEDANHKFWYLGKDNPVNRNGGDTATGTAQTDRNGYGVDLHSTDNGSPFEVDAAIIPGLIA